MGAEYNRAAAQCGRDNRGKIRVRKYDESYSILKRSLNSWYDSGWATPRLRRTRMLLNVLRGEVAA
jgi:hypothetical protein